MALMVLSALAVELYFKSFSILTRGGSVITGCDSAALYRELPDFLKVSFETEYARFTTCVATGSTTNPDQPPKAPAGTAPARFDEALLSLTQSFGAFRDNADCIGWQNVEFRCSDAVAVIGTLEATCKRLENGEFSAEGRGNYTGSLRP